MARQRVLHPEFFTDATLIGLQPLARILFEGLWTVADREGRLRDRPMDLKIRLLPGDMCDVDALLAELAGAGRIVRYQVGGERYIWIRKFSEYQHPHPREAASVLPSPPAEQDLGVAQPRKGGGEQGGSGSDPVSVSDPVAVADQARTGPAAAAVSFAARAGELRRAKKLPPDKPKPKTQRRIEQAESDPRFFAAYQHFLDTDEPYLRQASPPWPLDLFASNWERYLPSTTGPPKRDVRKGTTRVEDFYPPSKGKKQEDGSTF